MTAPFVYFPAPAKLNLFLHVLGQRGDGYHLLQTVFCFIDRSDKVGLRLREDAQIQRVTDLPGVAPEADLCVRAARLLQQESGSRIGVDIALQKVLPMGAGLGGGSSDAATTLIALNRLWGVGLSRQQLQELGARLGADVPIFIYGRSALAEGIGERFEPVELGAAWYLVLTPQVAVSTAEIFAAPELTRSSKAITIAAFFNGEGRNDLEPVVCRRFPAVAEQLSWLRRHRAAAMTGSGSCVFSAFDSEAEALALRARLPAGVSGFVARGLGRHPLFTDDAVTEYLGSRQAG